MCARRAGGECGSVEEMAVHATLWAPPRHTNSGGTCALCVGVAF